jgi:hypothetical protein
MIFSNSIHLTAEIHSVAIFNNRIEFNCVNHIFCNESLGDKHLVYFQLLDITNQAAMMFWCVCVCVCVYVSIALLFYFSFFFVLFCSDCFILYLFICISDFLFSKKE